MRRIRSPLNRLRPCLEKRFPWAGARRGHLRSLGTTNTAAPAPDCCCAHCRLRYRLQYCYWGFPPFFHEPALGSSIAAWMPMQVANGMAAQMALYQYDFQSGNSPAQLTRRGENGFEN